MRIAVLSGGRSSEHDVSLASAASVREGLAAGRPRALLDVRLERDGPGARRARSRRCTPARGLLGADAVFPALHGPLGEDGTVQGLLELLDVPYVGSGVLGSRAVHGQGRFKELMRRAGLPQVGFVAVLDGDTAAMRDARGAGVPVLGQARAPGLLGGHRPRRDRRRAARRDRRRPSTTRWSSSRRTAPASRSSARCSVPTTPPQASEPGEILLAAGEGAWYDYEAKYTPGGMELAVPARIPATARERVRELAVESFRLAGCSGLARADFFVVGERSILNELNTMPGFTRTSVYGKLWDASGLPYPELCEQLVRIAIARHEHERALRR